MTGPLAVFRIRPDYAKRRRYFTVRIFRTVSQARADARRHECLAGEPASFWNWSGLAHGHRRALMGPRGGMHDDGERGIIWFAKSRLWSETVAHEMAHMACRIAEEDGYVVGSKRTAMATEERFCHVLGHLVDQFWRNYTRVFGR